MLCVKFGWNFPRGSGGGGDFFFILSMHIHYFVIIYPCNKGGSSFDQTWIPFTQGCFVPSLVEIGLVVLEKKMKMWKVYQQTDGQQAIKKLQ